MHTTYSYNWGDGSLGSAPYIITATEPGGGLYSIRSENADWQYVLTNGSQTIGYSLKYFYLNQPSSFTDENGRITKYEYNSDNTAYRADNRSLKRLIMPEATYSGSTLTGGYTEYGYDSRRNVTSVSVYPKGGGAPQVSTYEYEPTCTSSTFIYCNKPKKYTDPKGNVHTYAYSTVHGQLLTETDPADANGVSPQRRYSYTPMYAQVLDSSFHPVSAEGPIYKLTQISTCRAATAADPAACTNSNSGVSRAYELVTTYAYNNNLLLTSETVEAGDGSVSATTSYGYDMVGNRVWVDGPRTDVDDRTYTTYDIRRRPVFEIGVDPDGTGILKRVVVKHSYDIDGRENLTQAGTGSAITFDSYGVPTGVSDFVVNSFKRNTFDSTTGLLIKSEVGQP